MHTKVGFEGYFTLRKTSAITGEVVETIGPFKNVIKNGGLTELATRGVLNGCTVGGGNTPESATDTTLAQFIARTNTAGPGNSTASQQGSTVSPYYAKKVRVWRFAAGTATGNISEVGVIYAYSSGYPLWSRSLVKDSSGNPVTITVLADEILDVTYECRVYMHEEFSESTFTLDGVTTAIKCGYSKMSVAQVAEILEYGATALRDGIDVRVGPLSEAPDRSPTGNPISTSIQPTFNIAADAAERTITQTVVMAPGVYTTTAGIKSLEFRDLSSRGVRPSVAFEFTPPLVKEADKELTIVFSLSWGRREI